LLPWWVGPCSWIWVSWNLMRWSWLSLCSATTDLSGCPSRMCWWCSFILVSMDIMSDIHLAALTGNAIHAWSPQSQIVLHRMEEAGDLPRRQANTLNVVPGQHSAEVAVCSLDVWQEGDWDAFCWILYYSFSINAQYNYY
jgi:hypothetical protein